MRIAFDVKGTLDGYKKTSVRRVLKLFYDKGHDIIIWSNSYGYAKEMSESLIPYGLTTNAAAKYSMNDAKQENKPIMDAAIEDDMSQKWLAANKIVWVHDIPDTAEEFRAWFAVLYESLTNSSIAPQEKR